MSETSSTDSDESTATRSSSDLESIPDPEILAERDGVAFTEATETLDRETYEEVRDEETDDGAALVGVTNDDGEVLLKDTCTGWLAPGANVAPGDDWTTAARREAESWLDVAVELEDVERVRRIDHRVEGDDTPDRIDDPFYLVFFRASLAPGETPPVDSDDENDPDVAWFDEVPDGVDEDLEDDVAVFFD